jgi:hypothetical protein
MHAAIIRSRALNALVALLAAVAFAATIAPSLAGDELDPRPEPTIMPGSICPPMC